MNNYAITLATLEKEYDIAVECEDAELAEALSKVIQYIHDVM